MSAFSEGRIDMVYRLAKADERPARCRGRAFIGRWKSDGEHLV